MVLTEPKRQNVKLPILLDLVFSSTLINLGNAKRQSSKIDRIVQFKDESIRSFEAYYVGHIFES